MNIWILFLVINSSNVEILQYTQERDCVNAASAVRKSLKAIDNGTKIQVFCEYKPWK